MKTENMALVQGWSDTRASLERWQAEPRILLPWAIGSLIVAVLLLAGTYVVARFSVPDPYFIDLPGVTRDAHLYDYVWVLFGNSLVLLLHALACVAGFMAGSSLPMVAENYSGVWRWVHDKAGPAAIAFVVAATLFSLCTQAYILGGIASSLADQLGISALGLIVALTPHAIPELFALFLPLAAWTIASRRDQWHELLAATFVTVAVAVPMLLVSGAIEVWLSPHLLNALAT